MSNARDACFAIVKFRAKLDPMLPTFISQSKTPKELMEKIITVLNLPQDDSDALRASVSAVTQSCVQTSTANQVNAFDVSKCAKALQCSKRKDVTYLQELTAALGKDVANEVIAGLNEMCVFNGDQSNTFSSEQTCSSTAVLDAVNAQAGNPIARAIADALTNAKSIDCNAISAANSSDDFSRAIQTCTNVSSLNQKNIAMCASGVHQSNAYDLQQKCTQSVLSATAAPATVTSKVAEQQVAQKIRTTDHTFRYIMIVTGSAFAILAVIVLIKGIKAT